MEEIKKPKELIYEKPRCEKCGYQSHHQNVMKHINSKKDVCSKYENGRLKRPSNAEIMFYMLC